MTVGRGAHPGPRRRLVFARFPPPPRWPGISVCGKGIFPEVPPTASPRRSRAAHCRKRALPAKITGTGVYDHDAAEPGYR